MLMSLILLLWMLFAAPFSMGAETFSDPPMEAAAKSALVIEIDAGYNTWRSVGSASLIKHKGKTSVLTAFHVATIASDFDTRACALLDRSNCVDLDGVFVMNSGGEPGEDWAVFYLEHKALKGVRKARISRASTMIGDEVYQAGVPFGMPWVNKATVAWWSNDWGESPVLMLDGFAMPGSSGSGVFDARGRIVGITIAVPVTPFGPATDMPIVVPVGNIDIF